MSQATQQGETDLVVGQQSYDIEFDPPFASPPAFFVATLQLASASGETFNVDPDLSTLDEDGVTVLLNGIPTALSTGAKINWLAVPLDAAFDSEGYMTYAAFVALVVEELGVNGNRRGIETQRARWIRDALMDLQRFIRPYRQGHTTTYEEDDLTEKGYAHLGELPLGAKPKAFYTVSLVPDADDELPNPNIERNRLDQRAWQDRQHMIDGRYDHRSYTVTISPFNRQFMVHPLINDETYLLMVWDGLKSDFQDNDLVPFPSQAAEAVASYVLWKILKFVDKRLDLAREEYAAYVLKRLSLFREENEAQFVDNKDDEYSQDADPAPGTRREQSGTSDIDSGESSLAIVFPSEFDQTPVVDCWVIIPDAAQPTIEASPVSITTTGFTAVLAGATPAAGFKIGWRASIPT